MRFLKTAAACLAGLVFASVSTQAKTLQVDATCRSFVLDGGTTTTVDARLDLPFTTWDGQSGHPLVQTIGNSLVYSGEFQPQGGAGRYVADYVSYANGVEQSYGTARLVLEDSDLNSNGIFDLLEEDEFYTADVLGSLQLDPPNNGTLNLDGRIERFSPSTTGSFALNFDLNQERVSYQGTMRTLRLTGQADYSRTVNANVIILALTYKTYNGATLFLTGTNTFQTDSANTLQLPAWQFVDAQKRVYTTKPVTLQRSGKKLKGLLQFNDANLDTSWADFVKWDIVLDDPNDANNNGIPDITDSPFFTLDPQDTTANEGSTATLTATAVGDPAASLQWYFNNVAIANATSSTLTLPTVSKTNEGVYHVIASNAIGWGKSASATLTVNLLPAVRVFTPAGQVPKKGVAAIVKAEASDPEGELASVDFYTSDGPPGTPVFTDITAPYEASLLHFTLAPLEVWAVARDSNGAAKESAHITLIYAHAPNFTQDPQNTLANDGGVAKLTSEYFSDPPGSIQWYFQDTLIPGATTTNLTISPVSKAHQGSYYAIATNTAGATRSASAFLTINLLPAVSITSPVDGQIIAKGTAAVVTVNATDPEGELAAVEFFTSDAPFGPPVFTDLTPPFEASIPHQGTDPLEVWVVARDIHGALNESAHITLNYADAPTLQISATNGLLNASVTVSGTPDVRHVLEFTTNIRTGWAPLATNTLTLVSNTPPVGAWKFVLPPDITERGKVYFRALAK